MKHVKEKVTTVSRWGDIPSDRTIEEMIPRSMMVIDKPEGPTSHQVSAWIRDLFGKKTSHSGTLDPNATGVLPMGIGRSVRLMDLLHESPKEYVAAMRFYGDISIGRLDRILKEFEGTIYQTPPVRAGVKRERRERTIHEIKRLDYEGEELLLKIRCQSGTYIRTLCKDLGKTMGPGGHMMQLRRTEAGGFTEEDMITLHDLRDAFEYYKDGEEKYLKDLLLTYEKALEIYPKIKVKDTAAGAILNGADLAAPGILEMDDFSSEEKVALISSKGEGLAIGTPLYDAEKIMQREEGLVFETDRVFSPSGEYPKQWK